MPLLDELRLALSDDKYKCLSVEEVRDGCYIWIIIYRYAFFMHALFSRVGNTPCAWPLVGGGEGGRKWKGIEEG